MTEKQFYIPSYNYWNVCRFLRPFSFNVDFADVYAQANPWNQHWGKRNMYSWNHSDYLVLSASVSTNYDRDCSQQSKGNSNPESDALTTRPRRLSGDLMKRSNYNDKGKKNKTYCLTVWTSLMLSSVNTKTNTISDMKVPKQTRETEIRRS